MTMAAAGADGRCNRWNAHCGNAVRCVNDDETWCKRGQNIVYGYLKDDYKDVLTALQLL